MSSSVSIQKVLADGAGGGISLHTAAVGVAYFGATLGVLMVAPQIARTLRDRHLPGVSVLSWALTALSCLTWMLYGVRSDEPPQIPGNVIMIIGAVVIVLAVPSAVSVASRAVRVAVLASVLVTLAFLVPAAAIGYVAFGIGLISALPQLVESLAGRRREASAVSVLSWLLRAASQVAWLFYAVALHDRVVIISASFILASALLVVATELWRRSARSARSSRSTADALAQSRVEPVEAGV